MPCPYCGGLNPDRNTYCTFCGRDMRDAPRPSIGQQPARPTSQPTPQGRPSQPYPAQPSQQSRQPQYTQPNQASQVPQRAPGQTARQAPAAARPANQPAQARPVAPVAPPPPPAPDSPAPFPPRTVAELQALEPGALEYTIIDSSVGDGRKKIVRIIFPRCTGWQQVATLLKALREQQDEQFDTILIQGVREQHTSIYSFTNGELRFDRKVRLGDAITNRYQIETDNGFASDALRIVLTA